jgi:hypothetical protein
MAKALWIGEDYLKENGLINGNADMKVVQPNIIFVQDTHIKRILGTDLFDEINGQIIANTVTALNTTLLTYITDCLFWYILAESTDEFKYRYMNKGVMVKNSDNSQPADLTDIERLISKYKNRAEYYAERTRKYLLKNLSSYPLYSTNADIDDIQPQTTGFNCSLYLPDSNKDDIDECRDANGFYA